MCLHDRKGVWDEKIMGWNGEGREAKGRVDDQNADDSVMAT